MQLNFDRIAVAIVSNLGNVLLCTFIVLFALISYFAYFRKKLTPALAGLAELSGRLADSETAEQFAATFDEFDQFVRAKAMFVHAWPEFTEALVFPRDGEGPRVVRHSQPTGEYFHLNSLLDGRLNVRFVAAMPSYLTGLGILGTFIGLVAGIYLASKGMNAGDVAQMRQSLQPLLSGAALAFWTSICGLVCSIVFSVCEKRAVHRVEQAIGTWNDRLERRIVRVTPEQLAVEGAREASKQTLQLERFNTDLAVSIAQALDHQLSQRFSPRLDQLVTGLTDLKGQQASFSHDVMDTVTKQLTKALSGAAGTEMMAVTETLGGLVKVLQQTSGSMSQSQQEMTTAITHVIGRLEGAFVEGQHALSAETTSTIERIAQHLDQAGGAAALQLTTASQKAAEAMGGAATHISAQTVHAIERLTSNMESASGQVAQSLAAASGEASSSFGSAASQAAAALEGAAEHAAERLALAATEAANCIIAAAGAVEAGAAKYQQTLEQMHSVLRAANDVSGGLRGTLQALQETHGAIRGTVDPLNSSIARLADVHQTVGTHLESTKSLTAGLISTAAGAQQTLVTLQQVWNNHERRFEQLDESAEKFVLQLRDGVDTFTGTVRSFVGELDGHFSKSLSELSSVVNELDSTVGDLETALRRRSS